MKSVLVIGGGIAGYCAALGARRDGAEVTILARAPGATALYAGAMEIADDLDALVKSEPDHPFSRLGMDSVGLAAELDLAVNAMRLALEKDGLKLDGEWRSKGLYADIHGLARPANLVPETVAPGELRGLTGRRVAVIGVPEVGDYDAASTAQALKQMHGIDAFAEEVQIPDLPPSASLTDLYGRRAPVPAQARASWYAYPPGFSNLPQGGFELLAAPPSPHGWRLQLAIGLSTVRGDVTSLDLEGDRVVAARTAGKVHRADSFVLATGRHIGGGLRGGRVTTEPLLGLGVYHRGVPSASLGVRLQHLRYIDPAEELRSGLVTDKRLHPLDEAGTVACANLHAAGAMLGGFDYAGPCGFGVPVLTGWLAGRYAARS
ncbi:MAG TPA: FAD-binding protein [Patescibacteria group bacterium]|nr:FAD-binding protein [Patescibacteria group bacterium]